MVAQHNPLLDRSFLRSVLTPEYEAFKESADEAALIERLEGWSRRTVVGETQIQQAFISRFFVDTWGYHPDGGGTPEFTLREQFPIAGAGAGGGAGAADLALGRFGAGSPVPQVLCEFKGVGADLDKPQPRKGSTRSPANQALDYLRFARRGFFDSEPVLPRFALVTDMNAFRLYWYDRGPTQSLRFRIGGGDLIEGLETPNLIDSTERARFERFLFWWLLKPDMLLSEFGRTRLERLIERQGTRQRHLEREFYEEYRAYRLRLYDEIKLQPLEGLSERDKLRLAQKLLDRFIFVLFAEDMGGRIAFPPHLLRDLLKAESLDRFFEPESTDLWDRRLKRLFRVMDEGGALGDDAIHRFNGGLFEHDALIDQLSLPNHLFCKRGQGRNTASIAEDKRTLLYLSDTYNFASEGDSDKSIGLYTLGHIFEQSIVELEKLEADAEGRPSLTEITKRKRDGVYYTPEPIVQRIVEETIGTLLAGWRREAGWPDDADPTREAADAYWDRLRNIAVVDPACGSGAFLITAMRFLQSEFHMVMETRYALGSERRRPSESRITAMILANNLFGVDINPLSAEIARLSLWLHTARANEPLSSLDATIRIGNSLVDPGLYARNGGEGLSEAVRERVAAFDWRAEFPEIFARGGFDAVIGNPPYVKLQNFRRVYAETADYLRNGVGGQIDYLSTQTGNFDLYLPFIEKGLRLLNEGGRMGYIAPNLWPTLQYGAALRRLVAEGRHLARWIDFRAHQVFEEATIYTAIQIFTDAPNEAIEVAFARDGDLGKVDWGVPAAAILYAELPRAGAPWLFAPEPVRRMIARLDRDCTRLGDGEITRGITVGIQTSADHIYHLRKVADGRYLHTPRKVNKVQPPPFEVAIEDAIMRPLISGAEAKRFIEPATDTYLLFPYALDGGARLLTVEEMEHGFPRAWAYLRSLETELRARESRKFDDAQWYRFGRNQNIDKQEEAKLIVPRLVAELKVAIDAPGEFYCDNVDVGGVIPAEEDDLSFLAGVLGSPATNMMFRWLSKPFRGDYLSANKQFIAPLPIPNADEDDRFEVGRIAEALQRGYTERARLLRALAERLGRVARRRQPHEWLLPDVEAKREIEAGAPARMARGEVRGWTDARYKEQVEAAIARMDDAIRLDSRIEARIEDDELTLVIDGAVACRGIYVSEAEAPFLLAQWQVVALGFEPKGKGDGKRLVDALRHIGTDAPEELRNQIIERQEQLARQTEALRALESDLHEITCRLFNLTREERALVESA